MNLKQLKETLLPDERAVSPVIGVILMVAITVILAAVIGTFVLNLGSNVKQNPQAGVSFEQGTDGSGSITVDVTVSSIQRADTITVTDDVSGDVYYDGSDAESLLLDPPTVGQVVTVGGSGGANELSSGDRIIVKATYQGNTVVIATYTVSG